MSAIRTYQDIKALSIETGRRIPDLLAMASQNDPFYIMPAQVKQAEWFAELWTRLDIPYGAHLRRIHYKLISQPEDHPVLMVDGRPYGNTEKCWQYLGAASKAARCLSLVDPTAFEDKRNPEPTIVRCYADDDQNPYVVLDEPDEWRLPEIRVDLADDLNWTVPVPYVNGYDFSDNDKPFHLELVSEKSTMDDVVLPLCQRIGINYAPATGFQSITGVIHLLQRVAQSRKTGVVFYVSDFDPAGAFMPASVARQIEFWRPHIAPEQEIILVPVVLTPEQVSRYQLPPIPIKETDKRQDNFLAKYDVQGATELDALEALHPGALRNIIIKAAEPYQDFQISRRLEAAEQAADEAVSDAWRETRYIHSMALKALRNQTQEIVGRYQARLESLREAINDDLAPIRESLDILRQAVKDDIEAFDPGDLPTRPESDLTLPDVFPGLFDSRRDYLTQLGHYKTVASEMAKASS